MKPLIIYIILVVILIGCSNTGERSTAGSEKQTQAELKPFLWENANTYFLLTDRFNNGNPDNDTNFNRTKETAKLRGFKGGDFKGITQKINEGYFDRLGINSIWLSPVAEQIHGIVDEGTGNTYAFHGYWIKDWTSLEPNFGTEEELMEMVEAAHAHGIRVLFDVIINHTGPVTDKDPVWPDAWVRTEPKCDFQDYEGTVNCTLVENLPDIKTESDKNVELPQGLKDKWVREGRLEKEIKELDEFFERTGYPRAPRYYIIKWLCDMIKKYGVDGFRVDTVKHTEAFVWADLYKEAVKAFNDWKKQNPDKKLDDNEFFMVGEVYNYYISDGKMFDFGNKAVNYFDNGFNSLINFQFKTDANKSYEEIFSMYSSLLSSPLNGKTVLNYVSSHDDGGPFDKRREKPMESATKLLLCPGGAQVYYGDETARSLVIEGTEGDATLRSFMNWEDIASDAKHKSGYGTKEILSHWQKLGVFRNSHPAVGAGKHEMISEAPYLFKRTYQSNGFEDEVMVGLDLPEDIYELEVKGIFDDGSIIKDYYSGNTYTVANGKISLTDNQGIVLLGI
ncbi:MAG TPA: alpha-amylase family glycosyl hydrolase [Cyclobacteriaceae bacterium]